jgi:hypothetical protein
MDKTRRSVDVFLRRLPEPHRTAMVTIDRLLTGAMPSASRRPWVGTFWGGSHQEIIGYGDLTEPRPDGETVDWFTVGLARQQRHFSLYVNAVENGQYLAHRYAERLGNVKVASASITFRRLDDLDLDTLRDLAIHAHRVARD